MISFLILSTILAVLLWFYSRKSFKKNILSVFKLNKNLIFLLDFLFVALTFSRILFRFFPTIHDSKVFLIYINFSFAMLGFAGLIILLLFILDIINFLDEKTLKESSNKSRRDFLKKSFALGGITTATTITGVGYQNSFNPVLNKITIKLPEQFKKLSGLTIAQLSDVHIGPTLKKEFSEELVNRVNNLNADLIVITGDLIDGNVAELRNDVLPLRNLKGKLGVFYVSGNHEYYWSPEEWFQFLDKELNFQILHNKNIILNHNDCNFALCGVTDMYGAKFSPEHNPNYKKANANLSNDLYRILLAHQPKSCFNAVKEKFDLQLSGHTHGGQGFPWNILVQFAQPYIKGLYNHEGMQLYVHSGTGFWGPPNRFMINSEIALIELVYS